MTKTRKVIEAQLGRPSDYIFDRSAFLGPYKGLINILGLRHKGVVISGTALYREVCETTDQHIDRYTFLYELTLWCMEYTGTETKGVPVGAGTIVNGTLRIDQANYFCVPAERKSLSVAS